MNEKDVAFFSTLLNIKAEDVESSVIDGTLGEKLTALGLMDKTQVETLKGNLTNEVRANHINELTELAKKGELPQDLYNPIKGAVTERLEKDLSKKYEVTEFNGVFDLVDKAIKTNAAKSDDKQLQELIREHDELKQVNLNLVKEKDEAVLAAKQEYEGKVLTRDKRDHINAIPFDFSDVEETELEKVTASRRKILQDVFDSRYSLSFNGDDKVIVKDKNDSPVIIEATRDPMPVTDVMKNIATELGLKLVSPESGGQGGRSSGESGSAKFKNENDFYDYCESKKILPTSAEGIKAWAEGRPQ